MENIELIKEKVKTEIQQITFVDKAQIEYDTKIFENGYIDSMGFAIIVTFLEESFNLSIKDRDLVDENFESVNAITNFITAKMAS